MPKSYARCEVQPAIKDITYCCTTQVSNSCTDYKGSYMSCHLRLSFIVWGMLLREPLANFSGMSFINDNTKMI